MKPILNAIFLHPRNYDGCMSRQWWDKYLKELVRDKAWWALPFSFPMFLFSQLFTPIWFIYDLALGELGRKK